MVGERTLGTDAAEEDQAAVYALLSCTHVISIALTLCPYLAIGSRARNPLRPRLATPVSLSCPQRPRPLCHPWPVFQVRAVKAGQRALNIPLTDCHLGPARAVLVRQVACSRGALWQPIPIHHPGIYSGTPLS